MVTYRGDGAWGTGKGANLTAPEVDGNFWELAQGIAALADNPTPGTSISNVTVVGSQMTIHLDDGTTRGPFTLPTAMIHYRGDWATGVVYSELDIVAVPDVGVYLVQRPHTAAATFDAAAVDGSGNKLYRMLFPIGAASGGGGGDGTLVGLTDTSFDPAFLEDGWILVNYGGTWYAEAPYIQFNDLGGVYQPQNATQGQVLAFSPTGTGWWEPMDLPTQGVAAVSEKAAAYIFAIGDVGAFVDYNAAGAGTFTIPTDADVAFPIGTMIRGGQIGAGALTIAAAAGVTLNGVAAGSAVLTGSAGEYFIRKRAANSWRITGDHGGVA